MSYDVPVHQNNWRTWLIFVAWVIGAIISGVLDTAKQRSLVLPAYLVGSIVVILIAGRRYRPPLYGFEIVEPGVVRSKLGFEVRVSQGRLQYVEGVHVVSWQGTSAGPQGFRRFSLEAITGWDAPYAAEGMGSGKKREVFQAVCGAIAYLQAMEMGRAKRPRA
jgi:hypothetical protein